VKQPITILDVPVTNLTLEEAVESILNASKTNDFTQAGFVNTDCLNIAYRNQRYKTLLQSLPLVFGDGSGVRYASRILGQPIIDNVNGTDLFPLLCEGAAKDDVPIYLLGGRPGVADKAVRRACKRYPRLTIAGSHHGYFSPDETDSVLTEIRESGAQILLVAMGAPHQELWIHDHRNQLGSMVALGVGGLLDFAAKDIDRAPMWVRALGMEWVVRLLNEPLRLLKRYLIGNPLFLWRCYRQKFLQQDQHFVPVSTGEESGQLPIRRSFDIWRDFEILDEIESKFSSLANQKGLNMAQKYRQKSVKRWFYKTRFFSAAKRMLDILGSFLAIVLLSPLFLLTGLAIRLDSPGSIFFKQVRTGRYGKTFDMYKFRSMISNAEQQKSDLMEQNESAAGVLFKIKKDPRITRVGNFIRKYSIDELPQLLNVLIGDMSLVGPRPPVPSEVDLYTLVDRRRLDVKPGITCIWQVSGRSDIDFIGQVKLDIDYIKTHSIIEDIKILVRTIPAVLQGKGAY
jgi:exopolysaccharide biosynthesis WecB/TagA/CpsF family protein